MLQEKASYKAAFSQLRGLKGEIEHLQLLLEQSRKKLQQDFQQWLGMVARQQAQQQPQQAQRPDSGGAAGNSSSSRPSTAGRRSGRSNVSSSSSSGAIAAAHQNTELDPAQQQQQQPARPPSGRLRKALSAVTAASVLPHQEGSSSKVLPRVLSSRVSQPLDLSKIDPQLLQAVAPHLTGNPDADADIIGFYEAKQKLLQLKLGGSSSNRLG